MSRYRPWHNRQCRPAPVVALDHTSPPPGRVYGLHDVHSLCLNLGHCCFFSCPFHREFRGPLAGLCGPQGLRPFRTSPRPCSETPPTSTPLPLTSTEVCELVLGGSRGRGRWFGRSAVPPTATALRSHELTERGENSCCGSHRGRNGVVGSGFRRSSRRRAGP